MQCGLLPILWQKDDSEKPKNWARLCTFRGSELVTNYSIDTLECINHCNQNPMCSHFSWELDEDTQDPKCHLFTGNIMKSMSVYSNNQNSVCGLKDEGGINPEGIPEISKFLVSYIMNHNAPVLKL